MNAGTMKTFFTAIKSRNPLLSAIRFHSARDGGLGFPIDTSLAVLSIGLLKSKCDQSYKRVPHFSRDLCARSGDFRRARSSCAKAKY